MILILFYIFFITLIYTQPAGQSVGTSRVYVVTFIETNSATTNVLIYQIHIIIFIKHYKRLV